MGNKKRTYKRLIISMFKIWSLFFLFIITIIGELFSFISFLYSHNLKIFLLRHIFFNGFFILAFYLAFYKDKQKQKVWIFLAGFCSFLIPIYGMIIFFLLYLLVKYKPLPSGDLLKEFKEHVGIIPKIKKSEFSYKSNSSKEILLAYLEVEPLVDMLDTPDLQLKRAVIEAMAKKKSPKLIAKIKECLKDPHPEIYQYALIKLSQLQEEFAQNLSQNLNIVKQNPDSLRAHLNLTKIYSDYIESGLNDETVEKYYKNCLEEEYKEIIKIFPREIEVMIKLGKLLMGENKSTQALLIFNQCLNLEAINLEARFGMVQCYYNLREYEKMYKEIKNILELNISKKATSKSLLELAHWWLTPDLN